MRKPSEYLQCSFTTLSAKNALELRGDPHRVLRHFARTHMKGHVSCEISVLDIKNDTQGLNMLKFDVKLPWGTDGIEEHLHKH
jgi:hypothetical protein